MASIPPPTVTSSGLHAPPESPSKPPTKKLKKENKASRGQSGNDRELSHALSWVLRHAAPSLGLDMSTDGYVRLDSLLSCGHRRFRKPWMEEDVLRVVANNDKQRFRLTRRRIGGEDSEDVLCIRANQGHSIPKIVCEDLLTPIPPEKLEEIETIVHGTYFGPWEQHIKKEGLSRMKRNHIHFAPGLPNESNQVISGMRSTCQVYIYVDGSRCSADGIPFYRSDNGVILTPGLPGGILPTKYFSRVVNAKTGEVIFKHES